MKFSESVQKVDLNGRASVVIKVKKKGSFYTNTVQLTYQELSDEPLDLDSTTDIIDFIKGIDLQDDQLALPIDGAAEGAAE